MRREHTRWTTLMAPVLCVLLAGCSGAATSQRPAGASTATPQSTATATSAPSASTTLYFGGETISSDGAMTGDRIYALNLANGSVRWSKPLSIKSVINVTAAGADVYATDMFGAITALNSADGSQLWQAKGHNAADSQPVADASALYIASSGGSATHGYVDAYSSTDGKVLWEHDFGLLKSPHLAITQGIVYVSTQNTLTALRATDGSVEWTTSVPWAAPSPYVIGDTVYLNYMGDVRAFNATNGSLKWHYAPTSTSMGDTSISGAGGLVFAGNGRTLTALHAADGSLSWTIPLQQFFYGTSAYNNVVYVEPGSSLVALDATTGAQVWNVTLSGANAAAPILSNGMLFESRTGGATQQPSGYIYALNPADGSVLWKFAHPGEVYTNLTVI